MVNESTTNGPGPLFTIEIPKKSSDAICLKETKGRTCSWLFLFAISFASFAYIHPLTEIARGATKLIIIQSDDNLYLLFGFTDDRIVCFANCRDPCRLYELFDVAGCCQRINKRSYWDKFR